MKKLLRIAWLAFAVWLLAVAALPNLGVGDALGAWHSMPKPPAAVDDPRSFHSAKSFSPQSHVPENQKQPQDSYTYSVLYNFCSQTDCADGDEPYASLIEDASGNFYGTTYMGGANTGCSAYRCGTIFKLDSSGNYSVLYSFCAKANCADGELPYAGLFEDSSGNLYGTTQYGGANLGGTVFKLDSTGHYSVLYNFCSQTNCADGNQPLSTLIQDASGNLYGTTNRGGATNPNCPYPASGCGTVFKLDPAGNETVLYSFCSQANCTDGYFPNAGLIEDASGNLYGTAFWGGENSAGTVFKLDSAGNYTVLYNFCSQNNCADGYYTYAGLIQDTSGNLYGTTYSGGNTNNGVGVGGGTVFKLDLAGNLTVLHTFCTQPNCTDGGNSEAGVIMDSSGNLYGTTTIGGPPGASGGTIFEIDSAGNYANLYTFCSQKNCTDGAAPYDSLIQDASGNLYGTTYFGGSGGSGVGESVDGVIFKLHTSIDTTTTLTLSPSTIVAGSTGPVVMTATVSAASGSTVPTGTVAFFNGSTQFATGALSNGTATFNYNPGSLALGTYSITASYDGTNTFAGSTSPPQILAVETASTTNLSLFPTSVTVGSNGPVVMTATVSPSSGSGTPTGTVTFFNGTTQIGTGTLIGGLATFDYDPSNLSAGAYSILASYGGDTSFVGSNSSTQTLTVNPVPDFSISLNPGTVTISSPGQPGSTMVTITPSGGFNQTITFTGASCSGLPTGSGCSFSPPTVTPNGNSVSTTLTITTTQASSAISHWPLRKKQNLFFALILPGLLVLGPKRLRKHWSTRGAAMTSMVLLLGLSIIGLNACAGGNSGGGGGGGGTPVGTYTVTVTAAASGLSHSTPITLVVN
jgi:uncharacterized repeat protein (TIGR03803 family)